MILASLPPDRAEASDFRPIWSSAKLWIDTYCPHTGVKAATGKPVRAGVDVSATTPSTGHIRRTRDNARLWAEMRGQGRSGAERRVFAGCNPLAGPVGAERGVKQRVFDCPISLPPYDRKTRP